MSEQIGPYLVVRELAASGARVLLAIDPQSNAKRAIKLLPTARLAQRNAALRFEREYRALQRTQCAHVVTVFEAGQHGDEPYFVMELLTGPSLRRFIDPTPLVDENGRPPSAHEPDVLAELVAQDRMARVGHALQHLCHALAVCHERDMIHCDVHPDNALVADGDVVKLIDFGVSREANEAGRAQGTGSLVVGTFKYLAPEAALGNDFDARLDLYLLGLTAYELLAGRHPFYSESSVGLRTTTLASRRRPWRR